MKTQGPVQEPDDGLRGTTASELEAILDFLPHLTDPLEVACSLHAMCGRGWLLELKSANYLKLVSTPHDMRTTSSVLSE